MEVLPYWASGPPPEVGPPAIGVALSKVLYHLHVKKPAPKPTVPSIVSIAAPAVDGSASLATIPATIHYYFFVQQ